MFFGIKFQIYYFKEVTKWISVMPREKEEVSEFFMFVLLVWDQMYIDFITVYCTF